MFPRLLLDTSDGDEVGTGADQCISPGSASVHPVDQAQPYLAPKGSINLLNYCGAHWSITVQICMRCDYDAAIGSGSAVKVAPRPQNSCYLE